MITLKERIKDISKKLKRKLTIKEIEAIKVVHNLELEYKKLKKYND